MSGDFKKEIDLIITAQLKNGRTIEGVTKSIRELEKALDEQAAAAKRGDTSLEELRSTLLSLQQLQSRLSSQAGAIGQFQRLAEQISNSEQRAKKAATALSEYQSKIGDVAKATDSQAEKLIKLGKASTTAETSLARQKQMYADMKSSLEASGVDINNLTDAQNRARTAAAELGIQMGRVQGEIRNFAANSRAAKQAAADLAKEQAKLASEQARQSKYGGLGFDVTGQATIQLYGRIAKAQAALNSESERMHNSNRKNSDALNIFNSSGRTTLSLLQRWRGEILSLTATYVGFYSALNLVKSSIEAFNTKQMAINQLTLGTGGDKSAAAKEFEYIADQAERLGINLENAIKGYAKFSASASLAGRKPQETKFVFESLSEVSRVAGLSKEQLDRVFFAVSQIYSKGRVMAEEFNQQLGDALPGLLGVAKKATAGKFDDFNKAMKDGKVTLDDFITIIAKYRETVSGQLPTAMESLSAQQERFNNAVFKFKLGIAEGGLAEAYGKLLATLTELMQSDAGKQFGQDLASTLSGAVTLVRVLAEHLDEVKLVLGAIGSLAALKGLVFLAATIKTLTVDIRAFVAGMKGASGAVSIFSRALGAIGVILLAWDIANYLTNKFPALRKALAIMVSIIVNGGKVIADGFMLIGAAFVDAIDVLVSTAVETFKTMIRGVLTLLKFGADAVGATQMSALLGKGIDAVAAKTIDLGKGTKKVMAELKADFKELVDITSGIYNVEDSAPAAKKKGGSVTTPQPSPSGGPAALSQEEIDKRLKAKEQLENALAAMEAKIARNERDNLASRINAIDIEYRKLMMKLEAFGGADGREMQIRLIGAKNELIDQETEAFNKRLENELNSLQGKLSDFESRNGKKEKIDLDARLKGVTDSYAETYRQIADYRAKLVDNNRDTSLVDAIKVRVDMAKQESLELERKATVQDILADKERKINELIALRKERIDAIAVAKEVGLKTDLQAAQDTEAVVNEMQPAIQDAANEAAMFAISMIDAMDPNRVDLFIAKMRNLAASNREYNATAKKQAEITEMAANGMTNAIDQSASSIGQAIKGTKSWGDAWKEVGNAFRNFVAEFLREIAKMIMKQIILNALKNSSWFGAVSGAAAEASTGTKHQGGVVNGSTTSYRRVNPAIFATAPRMHGGGIAGLAPDEYPTILQKNEEVLRSSDPRNIINGGAAAGGTQSSPTSIKIINAIDSTSVVKEALSSQETEKAIVNFMRANKSSINAALA